jgi:aspartate carbamoyltransferase catalytic subunit
MDGLSERSNPLLGRNLLSIKDLGREEIELILNESERMNELYISKKRSNLLESRIMASLFFEPSTRTRLSFESAMYRLDGNVIGFSDDSSTSTKKGETLSDTVKVISSYADVIVIRHPRIGSADEAAVVSSVPVINAGDGAGEHPTQALLDLFTVLKEKKKVNGLHVAIVGDLKHSRTQHSFTHAIGMFKNDITFIAPDALQIPDTIYNGLKESSSMQIKKSSSLNDALDVDVVYINRIQKERFSDSGEYNKFSNSFTIDKGFMEKANKEITLMNPLPRVNEVAIEVDSLKNSAYFRQAAYGVPVRMAVLNLILGGR